MYNDEPADNEPTEDEENDTLDPPMEQAQIEELFPEDYDPAEDDAE